MDVAIQNLVVVLNAEKVVRLGLEPRDGVLSGGAERAVTCRVLVVALRRPTISSDSGLMLTMRQPP